MDRKQCVLCHTIWFIQEHSMKLSNAWNGISALTFLSMFHHLGRWKRRVLPVLLDEGLGLVGCLDFSQCESHHVGEDLYLGDEPGPSKRTQWAESSQCWMSMNVFEWEKSRNSQQVTEQLANVIFGKTGKLTKELIHGQEAHVCHEKHSALCASRYYWTKIRNLLSFGYETYTPTSFKKPSGLSINAHALIHYRFNSSSSITGISTVF